MNRRMLSTLLCAGLMTACSGDDNNDKADNSTANNGATNSTPNNQATNGDPNNSDPDNSATNNQATNNATPNNQATNNATPNNQATNNTNNQTTNNTNNTNNQTTNNTNNTNNGPTTSEMEPNDDVAEATSFSPGDVLTGSTDDIDDDYFAASLTAGTILEIEVLSSQRPTEFEIGVFDENGEVPERGQHGDTGSKRQYFIPNDATYYVYLLDATSEVNSYEIATRIVQPSAASVTLPLMQNGDLDDGDIDVYELTDASADELFAVIYAERDPVLSMLDSVLIVYSPAGGLVAVNDDSETAPDQTFDSELSFTPTQGETYWFVVDAYWIETGDDNSYRLDVNP